MTGDALDYYARPGRFTRLDDGEFSSADVGEVVAVVQGLLVYDLFAAGFHGVELEGPQAEAIHQRDAGALLALASEIDDRPLAEARPPEARIGARCHSYARLTVAFLRAAGVPARSRCGFAGYFVPGSYEDHWVAEVWEPDEARWCMVDAQLDATWRDAIGFAGDPLAITESEFVTAGHAWQGWRNGELDDTRFGLSAIDEHGAHWIAGNLRLDLAALNKVEMLPWDVWGAGWEPGETPSDDQLRLFDEVAELTVDPDARFDDLRDRYESDDRLRMDGTVFNVARGRLETT